MSRARSCEDRGWLVDGVVRLPEDPCEFYRKAVGALVGCTRLHCSTCDCPVRIGPPGLGFKEDALINRATLYATGDWTTLPFVEQRRLVISIDRPPRIYACRCRVWEAAQVAPLENDGSEGYPDMTWSCAGHPTPELPLTLGALSISDGVDWAATVERILGGACPRPLEIERQRLVEGPAVWLGWLYAYLQGLELREGLPAAIAARAGDADPVVAGRVLHFFARFHHTAAFERLLERAEANPERVMIGFPIPESEYAQTLWETLVARLDPPTEDPIDARIFALVRKLLTIPLAALSHEDVGPVSVLEYQRRKLALLGSDLNSDGIKGALEMFAEERQRQRADVIAYALDHFSPAFKDDQLRQFVADHIVELDSVVPGRWRNYLNMLCDWFHKPDTGHLIVIAGMRLIESRAVGVDEFRAWMAELSGHAWVDDAWKLPLTEVLDKKPPVN